MPFGNVTNNQGGMPTMEGTYTLEVARIEDMEDGQFGPRMRWVFSATDEDGDQVTWDNGDPFEWFQQTGATLGPRSTARKWAEALLGRELREGETGEQVTDALLGRKARALVSTNEAGYSRIVGLTPLKKKVAPAKQQEDADPF